MMKKMHDLKAKLAKKGWNKSDVAKSINILEKAREKKHTLIKLFDKIVYLISLLIIIAANSIIPLVILPALITLNSYHVIFILIILGFSLGLLFEIIIRSIYHNESKYKVFIGVVISCVTIINIFLLPLNITILEEELNLKANINPLFFGIFYSAAFLLSLILVASSNKNASFIKIRERFKYFLIKPNK